MSFEWLISVFTFAVITSVSPGSNTIMIMSLGVNYGMKKSLPHGFGICAGFPIMIIAVGLGFYRLFDIFPTLHSIIQILGIVYLLFLAWKIAISDTNQDVKIASKPLTITEAAIFQWLNPKAWVVAVGAIAAYTSLNISLFTQILSISSIFFVAVIVSVGTWLFFGKVLSQFLTSAKNQRIFNGVMGISLALPVIPSIVELI
ncbi:LysE family translocator [Vibrio sp. Vb339]|uniref:LysE family translocator n=1 Tax=Vibrio sp. Vb339 TaxID=1192013 RepID=UPI001553B873|nr:LysE family translocator [Vibrio sp. Vb339]